MDDRKEKRVQQTTEIKIKDGDQIINADLVDISKKGMSVKTENVFPTYKVIDILIKIREKAIHLKGSVRWVNEKIDKDKDKPNEIGILLIHPPQEYLDYFDELDNPSDS